MCSHKLTLSDKLFIEGWTLSDHTAVTFLEAQLLTGSRKREKRSYLASSHSVVYTCMLSVCVCKQQCVQFEHNCLGNPSKLI